MAGSNATSAFAQLASPREAFFGLRTLFYACTPAETSFERLDQVPRFVDKATPFFFSLIILESFVLTWQGRKSRLPRWNDSFSSLAAGIVSQLPLLVLRNIEMAAYIWVHDNFCIYKLPWDSPWTWLLTMLGVDLGYYWVHRFAHEISFMWAGHQTHHSSEEYNLTTALRQGVFQRYSSWIFYMPLALFIPASQFVVHIQLNLLYQFWIHTETVRTLGPLEYILNTPSHHRVHHGVNRYCIDKNYAGVLIIWDRMFGTFEPERKDDEVVYGLTHQLNSWNPVYTQVAHWLHILSTASNMKGISNKISCALKGPGWAPGKPRLGLIEDIPDAHAPAVKFNPRVSTLTHVYTTVHFFLTLFLYETLVKYRQVLSTTEKLAGGSFILFSLTNIGLIYEKRSKVEWLEIVRCAAFLVVELLFISNSSASTLFIVRAIKFCASLSILFSLVKVITTQSGNKKID